jgi:hypothetical protein
MNDRLALAHAIEDASFERSKVENVATAIAHFIEGVKTDLKTTEAALHTAPASEVARLDTASNASAPMSSASVIARFVTWAFW